jgi:hypothetical protein
MTRNPDYASPDPTRLPPLRRWWPVLLALPFPATWIVLALPHDLLHPFGGILWPVAIAGIPVCNAAGLILGCLPGRRWTWAGGTILGLNAASLLIYAAMAGLWLLMSGIRAP